MMARKKLLGLSGSSFAGIGLDMGLRRPGAASRQLLGWGELSLAPPQRLDFLLKHAGLQTHTLQ